MTATVVDVLTIVPHEFTYIFIAECIRFHRRQSHISPFHMPWMRKIRKMFWLLSVRNRTFTVQCSCELWESKRLILFCHGIVVESIHFVFAFRLHQQRVLENAKENYIFDWVIAAAHSWMPIYSICVCAASTVRSFFHASSSPLASA